VYKLMIDIDIKKHLCSRKPVNEY